MTQVIFDPVEFKIIFPEFATVDNARLQFFFDRACLILSNEDCSLVQDIPTRKIILYLLTAHIGKLSGALAVDGKTIPVGRVSSATQGSISAEFEFDSFPGASQWWIQTQYGAEAWQMLISLRSFRYVPGCTFKDYTFPYPYFYQ